jgi:hypothetical protein
VADEAESPECIDIEAPWLEGTSVTEQSRAVHIIGALWDVPNILVLPSEDMDGRFARASTFVHYFGFYEKTDEIWCMRSVYRNQEDHDRFFCYNAYFKAWVVGTADHKGLPFIFPVDFVKPILFRFKRVCRTN